jgi:hypothetical protein
MSKVIFDFSMSLDGFMTAARQTGGAEKATHLRFRIVKPEASGR